MIEVRQSSAGWTPAPVVAIRLPSPVFEITGRCFGWRRSSFFVADADSDISTRLSGFPSQNPATAIIETWKPGLDESRSRFASSDSTRNTGKRSRGIFGWKTLLSSLRLKN